MFFGPDGAMVEVTKVVTQKYYHVAISYEISAVSYTPQDGWSHCVVAYWFAKTCSIWQWWCHECWAGLLQPPIPGDQPFSNWLVTKMCLHTQWYGHFYLILNQAVNKYCSLGNILWGWSTLLLSSNFYLPSFPHWINVEKEQKVWVKGRTF